MRHVFVVCIIWARAFWSNIIWVMLVIHQVCLLQTFTKRTARVELSDPRTANNVLFQFRRRSRLEDIFQTFGCQWKWNDISKNMVSRSEMCKNMVSGSEISKNMVSKSNLKKIIPFCLLNNLQVFFEKFSKKTLFSCQTSLWTWLHLLTLGCEYLNNVFCSTVLMMAGVLVVPSRWN